MSLEFLATHLHIPPRTGLALQNRAGTTAAQSNEQGKPSGERPGRMAGVLKRFFLLSNLWGKYVYNSCRNTVTVGPNSFLY